jgi:hypothetical protein
MELFADQAPASLRIFRLFQSGVSTP